MRRAVIVALTMVLGSLVATPAAGTEETDEIYFSATTNIQDTLIEKINAETVRLDMAVWHLTERPITQAVLNRFRAGVPVRLLADRGEMFEIDPRTKAEIYYLANEGVPIRLRVNPTWYPEISHWKVTIFAGQDLVTFGSANYTPFELAPFSPTNYKDETVLFTRDPAIVNAVRFKFDQIWNDTTPEPESLVPAPPYLKDWDDACATEPTGNCADYTTLYPNPLPMIISTDRLEPPDVPLPADLIWGQGPSFNSRLIQEINREHSLIQFVIYRLTVSNITDALLAQWASGVQMQLMVEPQEYLNRKWPEFWLTHANIDRLWAAGVPIKRRLHQGLTHMKTIVTSSYATNASSNYAAAWQRDVNYFIAQADKPAIYQAIKDQVTAMWNDPAAFEPFQPLAPDTPALSAPLANATGVPTTAALVWDRTPFATDYDVYLGTSPSSLVLVGNVPAQLVNNPPLTYSFATQPLQSGTTYFWRVVARTFATPVDSSISSPSSILAFTTEGSTAPPAAASSPSPSDAAVDVSTVPTLGWSTGALGTTFNVAFGVSNPPVPVASGLTSSTYAPGALAPSTTYHWQVTAVSSGGTTPGPVWSFSTASSGGATPVDVVIYATDVTTTAGTWTRVTDTTAAEGTKLTHPDNVVAALPQPLANPANYFETSFDALGGTRYRVWMRVHAIGDQKWNDSVFVQFSDSLTSTGSPAYRIGTPGAYIVNLWTCADCQSFGWGWQRNAYWLADTGDVWFQNSGLHTIRVQTREDGAEIDQIILSPVTHGTNPPGPVSNDTTIVPRPTNNGPGLPSAPNPEDGAFDVSTTAALVWTSIGATSYDVRFGATNPPPQVVTGSSSASYTPSLASGTTYFWQVVAHNAEGTTTGSTWSFTTASPPVAPPAPSVPSPVNGATAVTPTPVLTWTAPGATSFDVLLGTSNPPPPASLGQAGASYAPPALAHDTTYFWQVVARNTVGETPGPVWSFTIQPAPPDNVVVYASDVPLANLHGSWSRTTDATAANGTTLVTTDIGAANLNNPSATPADYFDLTFTPSAGVSYRLWLRLKALNNNKFNDAVWVQFSDARANGNPVYPIGSTAGLLVNLATDASASSLNAWGWQNGAYWLAQPTTLTFPAGTQTMRVQIREDGVQLDQIVLSPAAYLNTAPGTVTNDTTIVPKPTPPGPPASPASPTPADAVSNVGITPTLTWSAAGATSYDVKFGTSATPPLVVAGQAASSYMPATLQYSTPYHWQIVARNGAGTIDGPIWSFTTEAPPPPPAVPGSPTPANGATSVSTAMALSWSAPNATTFDVKFGTVNPPPTVATGQTAASFSPALAAATTYFWQVIAHNATGSTPGAVWSFTTAATPPTAPASPSPAAGATPVSPTTGLSWSASGASSYDVKFGVSSPPPVVSSAQPALTYTPGTLAAGTTYFWQVVANNAQGSTPGPIWSFTTAVPPPTNIVIYASDIPLASLHGSWSPASDPASPNGVKLVTTDIGAANLNNPVASPSDYVDVNFTAAAGTPYTIWLRLKALNNNKFNDAVWVQFSGAVANGAPVYPINSTSGLMVNLATDASAASLNGWGWQNTAYWLSQGTTVTFPTGGSQTLRVQIREDGVALDQIVLSPTTYLGVAPGLPTNDTTIVPKP